MIETLNDLYGVTSLAVPHPFSSFPTRSEKQLTVYRFSPAVGVALKPDLNLTSLKHVLTLITYGNYLRFPNYFFSRRYLRKLYASPFFRRFLTTHRFSLMISPASAPDAILKTRFGLKLFFFQKKAVITIASSPKNNRFFEHERKTRRQLGDFALVNRVLESGQTSGGRLFFKEPLLSPEPTLIDKSGSLNDRSLRRLAQTLVPFYRAHHQVRTAKEYLGDLLKKVGPWLQKTEGQKLTKVLPGLNDLALTLSHGDLVPANVMRGEKGLVLIDWSYTGIRTVTFDLFTLYHNLAQTKGVRLRHDPGTELPEAVKKNLFAPIILEFSLSVSQLVAYQLFYFLERAWMWISLGQAKSATLVIQGMRRELNALN